MALGWFFPYRDYMGEVVGNARHSYWRMQNGYALFRNSGAQVLCVRWVMRRFTPEETMPPLFKTRSTLASLAAGRRLALGHGEQYTERIDDGVHACLGILKDLF